MSSQADPESMDLPIIDLDIYLAAASSSSSSSPKVQQECQRAADALITYGALILHDSRVLESDNEAFLDLLEDYFAQPPALLRRDERPQLSYQIGVTLENTEKPKCAVDEPCLDVIRRLHPSQRPLDIAGHQPDPKCRFFWRMGLAAADEAALPYKTQFPGLNAANVVPEAAGIRDRWEGTMDTWGNSMKNAYVGSLSRCLVSKPLFLVPFFLLSIFFQLTRFSRAPVCFRIFCLLTSTRAGWLTRHSVSKLSEMAAIGLGLPASYFSDAAKYGFVLPTFHPSIRLSAFLPSVFRLSPPFPHSQRSPDHTSSPPRPATSARTRPRTPSSPASTLISTSSPSTAARAIQAYTFGPATRAPASPSRSPPARTTSSSRPGSSSST